MRLNEIENTEELLKLYFKIGKKYTIINGIVDMKGSVFIKSKIKFNKLPVRFGKVGGFFYTPNAGLLTLDGFPTNVGSDFTISSNKLTSLEGSPKMIGGSFSCGNNQLNTFEGGPDFIGNQLDCRNNPLISLKGIAKEIINGITMSFIVDLPLLPLMFIKSIKHITFIDTKAHIIKEDLSEILNKYLRQGQKGAILCAAELTKAGYKGNARM